MWDRRHIVELAVAALRERARAIDEETAVRGIDALSEVEIQGVLAAGFGAAGLGVFRERRFPTASRRGSRLAKDSERNRCDVVLTPRAGAEPLDPMVGAREEESAKGTLFEGVGKKKKSAGGGRKGSLFGAPRHEAGAKIESAGEPSAGATRVEPEECFWLEIKVVGQFEFHSGVPQPNRSYAGVLVGGLREDLRKLAGEERILWGGSMMVVFAGEERIATHDWAAALSRAMARSAPLRGEEHAGFSIRERIGNAWCMVGLAWP